MAAEKLLKKLEEDFNNPKIRKELLEELKMNIVKKTNVLKVICFDTLISNLNNKNERKKLIEQFNLSTALDKAKSLFLNPFINTQVHIGLAGKDLVKSETTTTKNETPNEINENTQNTTKLNTLTDKAENLLIEFEKNIKDTKKRKKMMDELSDKVDELLPNIMEQCTTNLEKFFSDEQKKKELVNYLQKDPLISKAEYFTFEPVVSLFYQYMYSLKEE